MADDLLALAKKLDQMKAQFDGTNLRRITTAVATKSKATAIPVISPNTLSHWGKGGRKGGYKVSATYEIRSDSQAAIRPTIAPLIALLEDGSGDRWSAPKRKGSPRRKKGTAGKGNGYDRTPVPARHAWSKAVARVEPPIPGIVHDEVQRVLREVWG